MSYNDRIEINPFICSGKPIIKGTRILVSSLLNQLAAGESAKTLQRGYPGLTEEDVQAALEFAAATIENVEMEELV